MTCQQERSAVAHVKTENPEVTIIGVANPGDGEVEDRVSFIAEMTVQIPHVHEEASDIWFEFEVASQPSMIFVNADGTFERRQGGHDADELLDLAHELLAAS